MESGLGQREELGLGNPRAGSWALPGSSEKASREEGATMLGVEQEFSRWEVMRVTLTEHLQEHQRTNTGQARAAVRRWACRQSH